MKGTSAARWMALFACPCMALAQHTEGFIGFRWGTPLQEIRQKLELTPVRELDDRAIGTGKPGPITKKVQEVYFAAVKGGNPKYASWLTYI